MKGLPVDLSPEPDHPTLELSEQQEAVMEWVRTGPPGSAAFIEAVAGSGKTTTLVEACRHMTGAVVFTAYNKAIADEIGERVAQFPNVRAATFHSLGFAAWRGLVGNVRVDAREKWRRMMDECKVRDDLRQAVGQLVSLAKQAAVEVVQDTNDARWWQRMVDHYDVLARVKDTGVPRAVLCGQVISAARRGVDWSAEVGGEVIDFDDMTWLPLLKRARFGTFDWVLVDEAQDTNVARRLIAEKMRGDRMLWVGDRRQAIYGFTGATANAVQTIVDRFDCQQLPLTVTYRCSKAATKLARQWTEIEAHEGTQEGRVQRWTAREFMDDYPAEHRRTDAILCRLTRPLVELAFILIRAGVACHVEGRAIGKQMTALVKRWPGVTQARDLTERLVEYRREEARRLAAEDAMHLVEALRDKVAAVLVMTEGCATVSEVLAKIERLFADTRGSERGVTLATVHRAKGREWERVFVLGWQEYMPSKWAKQAWQQEQEANLQYVAVTRTKGDLVLVEALDREEW